METDESTRKILAKFPYKHREDQVETLAKYFEAKKTHSKINAADAIGMHPTTATEIEETYEDLTEQEKTKLNQFLLKKQIEESEQVEADEEGLPA